jgi:hypothetical protein
LRGLGRSEALVSDSAFRRMHHAGDLDLQFLLFGESRLELIEVRAAGFGMPRLEDGETPVIGQIGYEVDDLEDTKAEVTRRWVVLEGEGGTEEVHWIFTAAADDVRGDPAVHEGQGV